MREQSVFWIRSCKGSYKCGKSIIPVAFINGCCYCLLFKGKKKLILRQNYILLFVTERKVQKDVNKKKQKKSICEVLIKNVGFLI